MNGSESHNAAAASSGNHNPIGTRQDRNDRQAFESLLLLVFEALTSPPRETRKEVDDALAEVTKILRRYVAVILAAWRIPSAWAMAEEVVQDLFATFLGRNLAKRYDAQRSTRRTFLFSVLRKVLSQAFRKNKRRRTVPLPEDMMDPALYRDEASAMHEIRDELTAAIGRLSPALKAAIHAQDEYGDGAKAAAQLGLKLSAFHARTSRARQALREDLKDRLDS
ncbi:MAG TPA: hypothetical protein VHX86_06155 [Tepidisphaeraceae bacterium]|nr:hypothetical protein [Tepidisphaeraceae bacterium]